MSKNTSNSKLNSLIEDMEYLSKVLEKHVEFKDGGLPELNYNREDFSFAVQSKAVNSYMNEVSKLL